MRPNPGSQAEQIWQIHLYGPGQVLTAWEKLAFGAKAILVSYTTKPHNKHSKHTFENGAPLAWGLLRLSGKQLHGLPADSANLEGKPDVDSVGLN